MLLAVPRRFGAQRRTVLALGAGPWGDGVTPKPRARSENNTKLRAEPVWDPNKHLASWRAVWAYSSKRAVRDTRTLTLQENKAKAVIAGEKTARTPRFVKTDNGTASLDEVSLTRARKLVGLKGYVTNIPATKMPAGEVISSYHALWQVEQSSRMSKTDLRARPMFSHLRDSIEAHLTVVFTALAIARHLQNQTDCSIRHIVRTLRPLQHVTIKHRQPTHHRRARNPRCRPRDPHLADPLSLCNSGQRVTGVNHNGPTHYPTGDPDPATPGHRNLGAPRCAPKAAPNCSSVMSRLRDIPDAPANQLLE